MENKELNKIIAVAVIASIKDPAWKVDTLTVPDNMKKCISKQNQIGWDHILYG
jgi:hypothetical protein